MTNPASTVHNNVQIRAADKIRYLRVGLIRELERLLDRATDPQFTGTVGLELSSKEGRPGEPRITVTQYGMRD